MIFLIGAFSVAHVLFCLNLVWRWNKIPLAARNENSNSFSVVIPTRNEEGNIGKIIQDILRQDYPADSYEIIVVDDFSTDATKEEVQQQLSNTDVKFTLISLEDKAKQGKKHALTTGIGAATNDIILTTDADCRVGPKWIHAFDCAFSSSTQIVAGPVSIRGQGLFSDMQKNEFAGLVAFGGVTLTDNNPSMCSGANLGFRRQAFFDVGGYEGNISIPSGDDEFLLYDIIKKYPNSGRFLKDEEALVETTAHSSIRSFINQRARWTSKWKHNKNIKLRLTAILFFLDYLFYLAGWAFVLQGAISVNFMLGATVVRFGANHLLVKLLSPKLTHMRVLRSLFWLQIFYPFHVLFMGLISIFGRYTWKGRKY